jgi:hypothetical protein
MKAAGWFPKPGRSHAVNSSTLKSRPASPRRGSSSRPFSHSTPAQGLDRTKPVETSLGCRAEERWARHQKRSDTRQVTKASNRPSNKYPGRDPAEDEAFTKQLVLPLVSEPFSRRLFLRTTLSVSHASARSTRPVQSIYRLTPLGWYMDSLHAMRRSLPALEPVWSSVFPLLLP